MTSKRRIAGLAICLLGICPAPLSAQGTHVPSEGPDIILGELDNLYVYATVPGVAGLGATTVSCNAGNKPVNWFRGPDTNQDPAGRPESNKHPVIGLNFYRLLNGRMQQLGQSWLKHGFFAEQEDACHFGCQATDSTQLGPGCSDPYGSGINHGPRLGPRSAVNPVTGNFDASAAAPPPGGSGVDRGLQVAETDLGIANARYFIEGQYIAADDSAAGNGLNNTSYREVTVDRDQQGGWRFSNRGLTMRQKSAVEAWRQEGASVGYIDTVEAQVGGKDVKSRIVVAFRVYPVTGTRNRYEYAVYNMNSDRGVRSFTVRIGGTTPTNVGFSAVRSHDEASSNAPWTSAIANGSITWSTKAFSEDKNANALRWGTTYNFWFEADAPPVDGTATLAPFKPGMGPDMLTTSVKIPSG